MNPDNLILQIQEGCKPYLFFEFKEMSDTFLFNACVIPFQQISNMK